MKKFCECNSEWCSDMAVSINRQIQTNLNKITLSYDGHIGLDSYCMNCHYWYWYDADYENMMFDLRSMNQM